jgi:predicted regulator of Ras-like GTPase activity (Roadblock/LC7/MglB family)
MTRAHGHPQSGLSRSIRLGHVLTELVAQVPEIEAASVVSFDGLPMAAALPPGMEEDRVAAMSAALLSLGERAAEGLGRGELSQVYVEGDEGTVFLVSAEDEAVLVAVTAKGAKVGLMLFEVRRAATAVAEVLRVEPLLNDVTQPAYDDVAAPRHAEPLLHAAPEPTYHAGAEAFEPSPTPAASAAQGSAAAASVAASTAGTWYAADTILPDSGPDAADVASWS